MKLSVSERRAFADAPSASKTHRGSKLLNTKTFRPPHATIPLRAPSLSFHSTQGLTPNSSFAISIPSPPSQ